MKSATPMLLAVVLGFSYPAFSQDSPEKAQPGARPAVSTEPKVARPFTPLPKLEHKISGGKSKPISAKAAGLPLADLPGAKHVTFSQWRDMKQIPKTGLFLVETEHLPANFQKQLLKEGYVLQKDGTLLDKDKQPVALFVMFEMFEIDRGNIGKQSSVEWLRPFADIVIPLSEAANPYPFDLYSWSMRWRYRGGYCRDYRAWTDAESWGPLQGGTRPHTRIEYMETRAEIGSRRDRDSCRNCDNESSYARWDIGCFWPAHGSGSGWHYANWKDGAFSATRTWSWSH